MPGRSRYGRCAYSMSLEITQREREGINIIDLNGRLTVGPGDNEAPTWSPNGRHLAFQASRLGGWQIFTMLADGSEQAPITRGTGERTSPSWSPRLP